MLSKDDIDKYLDTIPPIPQTIKTTLFHLNNADMVQAANIAKDDKAFVSFLSEIVNKPIFGFRDEVKNVKQIFGILGLERARVIVSSYYTKILAPKNWEIFNFSNKKFQDLQANLMAEWNIILKELDVDDKNLQQSISLVPASLIVCEMLFRDIKDTIIPLREIKQMSFDEILFKMSGYRLFDIVSLIAEKWELDVEIIDFIKEFSLDNTGRKEIVFLKLLLWFEMSKPYVVNSGLNDFFDLEINFSQDNIEKFMEIKELF